MPHRRHRVRVHVHNRYLREAEAPKKCKKRCKKCCKKPCKPPSKPCSSEDVILSPVPCQRYQSAEEVCRRCPKSESFQDSPCGPSPCGPSPCGRRRSGRQDGGPCERFLSAEQGPPSPCQRFMSAEETCRGCRRRDPGSYRSAPDVQFRNGGAGGVQYIYTAMVQHQPKQKPEQETALTTAAAASPVVYQRPPPAGPNCITEEIIHTREHRWHIPACRPGAAGQRGDADSHSDASSRRWQSCAAAEGQSRRPDTPRPGPPPAQQPAPREPGRSASSPLPEAAPAVDRTQSELEMGRRLVTQIAQRVELEDNVTGLQQVYHIATEYQPADGELQQSAGSSGSFVALSDGHLSPPDIQRLRLSDSSDSDCGTPAVPPRSSHSQQTSPERPLPLPRRQVTSEPMLSAPPVPPTRATRSLECQAPPLPGRVKKLRTRGALTRLRERSLSRSPADKPPPAPLETITLVAPAKQNKKPDPDSDIGRDPSRGRQQQTSVYHAMGLLPAEDPARPAVGSRGDGEITLLYQDPYVSLKPGRQGVARPSDVSPIPEQEYEYRNGGSPYLDPAQQSRRARFDDDDELGSALYEQRYQPYRDNSPYLTRPDSPYSSQGGRQPGPLARQPAGGKQLTGAGGQTRLGGQTSPVAAGAARTQKGGIAGRGRGRGRGIAQRLTQSWTSFKERGQNMYQRMSAGRGRGRGAPAKRGGGKPAGNKPSGRARKGDDKDSDCDCCSDSDSSDCGAINCTVLFYFNGDGGYSPFMSNLPQITGCPLVSGPGGKNTGSMGKKYCGMCD